MKLITKMATAINVSLMVLLHLPPSLAQTPSIEMKAENTLQEMLNYLKEQSSLKFQADVAQDLVFTNGQKIQVGAIVNVKVRRPDKLNIDYQGDRNHIRFYFDGKTFTMEGLTNKVYANFSDPSEVDNISALVTRIGEKLNITLPLGEIISTDNDLESIKGRITSGIYVGESQVNGIVSHHLAFTQDNLDWQIWIEKGEQPLPRKLVITYKQDPLSPQYSAVLSDWNFDPISEQDPVFSFQPAKDADEIDFLIIEP
ncbi:DUF2092 domain-containing protein [Crocosphaera sp. Alani8]|uniref:DUF2092 domain-containing protein n=1 Tax=Crocosphaera sp. Alani8 TaxID=3038952 RepID=UPI00313A9611